MEMLNSSYEQVDISSGSSQAAAVLFAGIGAYHLGKAAWSTLGGFMKYCLLPRRNLNARYGGGWALVTGASDGLGKEYARNLA